MGPGSYLFQVYRNRTGVCCWRLVSPNGRALGASFGTFAGPVDARKAVAVVVEHVDRLEAVLRTQADHRWLWVLNLDGESVVRGAVTQDRHVRCVMAWQRFVLAAPLGTVSQEVLDYSHAGGRDSQVRRMVAPL